MTVRETTFRYSTEGAKAAQRADEGVRSSVKETGKTARQESGSIDRWMTKNKAAITAIGATTAGVLGAILSASPRFRAELRGIRTAFTLFADDIVNTILPGVGTLSQLAIDAALAWREWDSPLKTVISWLIALGPLLWGAVKVVGALWGAITTITGALSSFIGFLGGLGTAGLAAAAALGALLGVIGVGILEVTGVNDAVEDFGRTVGNALPGWVRDGMLAVTSLFLGPLAVIGGAIRGFVQGFLEDGLVGGLRGAVAGAREVLTIFVGSWRRTLSRIGSVITGAFSTVFGLGKDLIDWLIRGVRSMGNNVQSSASDIKDRIMDGLPSISDMKTLGEDIIEGLADGIRGAISSVGDAAGDVAGGIRDRLPGSDAKTGPLSDFTSVPDTMASTLASFADDRRIDRAGESAAQGLRPDTAMPAMSGGGETTVTFEAGSIVVQGGGKGTGRDVAREVADEFEKAIGRRGG